MEVPRKVIADYGELMSDAIAGIKGELSASLSLVDYNAEPEAVRQEVTLLMDASTSELHYRGANAYGDRYFQDVVMEGNDGRTARVIIAWIKRPEDDKMQLTSAYVKE